MRKLISKTVSIVLAALLLIGCVPFSFASAATSVLVANRYDPGIRSNSTHIYVSKYGYYNGSGWNRDTVASQKGGSGPDAYWLEAQNANGTYTRQAAFCIQPNMYYPMVSDGWDVEYTNDTQNYASLYWHQLSTSSSSSKMVSTQIARTVKITQYYMEQVGNDRVTAGSGEYLPTNAYTSNKTFYKKHVIQVAGQAVIRDFLCGYRNPSTAAQYSSVAGGAATQWLESVQYTESVNSFYSQYANTSNACNNLYLSYYTRITKDLQSFSSLPGSAYSTREAAAANVKQMNYDASTGTFTYVLNDSNASANYVLDDCTVSVSAADAEKYGITVSTYSATTRTVTITATKEIDTPITVTIKKNKFSKVGRTNEKQTSVEAVLFGYKYNSNGNGQAVISTDTTIPDPAIGYIALKTENIDISIHGTKLWDDNKNNDRKRPSSIHLQLYRVNSDGTMVDAGIGIDVTGDPTAKEWEFSFGNVPSVDENGNKIKYTIVETAVDADGNEVLPSTEGDGEKMYVYDVVDDGNGGFTISNRRNSDSVFCIIRLIWDDENNCDGLRPDTVSDISLMASFGSSTVRAGSYTLTKDGNFGISTTMSLYLSGQTVKYALADAVKIPHYTTTIDTTEVNGGRGYIFRIVAKHVPTPEFSVENLTVDKTELLAGESLTVEFDTVNWKKLSQSNISVDVLWDDEVVYSEKFNYAAASVSWVNADQQPTYPEDFGPSSPDTTSDLHHTVTFSTTTADIGAAHVVTVRVNWDQHDSEVNPNNNRADTLGTYTVVVNPSYNLSIEAVQPNADYRAGTSVVTSFNIFNHATFIAGGAFSGRDVFPDQNLVVNMKVIDQSGNVIVDMGKECVVCPAATSETPESQLVYFVWDVPESTPVSTLTVIGTVNHSRSVPESDFSDNTSQMDVQTCLYTISETEDPGFTKDKPAGWYESTKSVDNSVQLSQWEQWSYDTTNVRFYKTRYSLITQLVITLSADDNVETATYDKSTKTWTIKSGYGINAEVRALAWGVGSSEFTAIQYVTAHFPEFDYSVADGFFRTLEVTEFVEDEYTNLYDPTYEFRENANAIANESGSTRKHFIPLWYRDGGYMVEVVGSDCWTPAGMVVTRSSDEVIISGSMYDDYYTSRG